MSETGLARKFPSLMFLRAAELGRMVRDQHSVMYGETVRWRMLFAKLDQVTAKAEQLNWSDQVRMEVQLQTLHDYYVGSLRRASGRKTIPMYEGCPADFERNYRIWRDACRDVEELYDYLISYLPRYAEVRGQNRDLHHRLRRPDEVRSTHNPIKLIELARRTQKGKGEWVDRIWIRHAAQAKLVLAQACFEYRRAGYASETLEDESVLIKRLLERTLFKRASKQKVRIIASLDPERAYACHDYHYAGPRETIPPLSTRFMLETNRYILASDKNIPIMFFIRPKRFPVLKGLIKDIRFPQLANIGDGIAMTFAIDDETHLDEVVSAVRRVLAPCPGMVCDQDSNLGHREGRRLDQRNTNSSHRFRAMKYNASIADRIVEVQFLSMRDFIDSKCRHDDAHHGCYKLKQYCKDILPVLFPEVLFEIDWPSDFVECNGSSMPTKHLGFWEELVAHVRAYDSKGR